MPDYIERQRLRSDRERDQEQAAREEHLDWLHEQHLQLTEQTALMRKQTAVLERIATHTSLLYGLGMTWIILTVLGGTLWLLYAASLSHSP